MKLNRGDDNHNDYCASSILPSLLSSPLLWDRLILLTIASPPPPPPPKRVTRGFLLTNSSSQFTMLYSMLNTLSQMHKQTNKQTIRNKAWIHFLSHFQQLREPFLVVVFSTWLAFRLKLRTFSLFLCRCCLCHKTLSIVSTKHYSAHFSRSRYFLFCISVRHESVLEYYWSDKQVPRFLSLSLLLSRL